METKAQKREVVSQGHSTSKWQIQGLKPGLSGLTDPLFCFLFSGLSHQDWPHIQVHVVRKSQHVRAGGITGFLACSPTPTLGGIRESNSKHSKLLFSGGTILQRKPQYTNQINVELICLKSWWGASNYLVPSTWKGGFTRGPRDFPDQLA